MAKLYIANCKAQSEAFTYVVPDETPQLGRKPSAPRLQPIPSAEQILISGDLSIRQLEMIIDQHRKYGLIGIDQIDRSRAYAGLCFQFDKPITPARIHQLMSKNIDILEERGREMRERAAIATHNQIEGTIQDAGMPGRLGKLETTVEEVRTPASDTKETVPQRIRVSRDAPAPAGAKRVNQQPRRRAG